MLLRKTPLSKKLTSEEVEGKLKDVVSVRNTCTAEGWWEYANMCTPYMYSELWTPRTLYSPEI